MRIDNQLTLCDVSREYLEFVDKFKPKKTTDDCYTPANVYEAVLDWVVSEYGIDREKVMRPFWPGCDYLREDYPDGCVVVDNPPFSIISQICRNYMASNIKFFLFAPYLTNFSARAEGMTHIITDCDIEYENGAIVNTAFLTNLDEYEVRTAPKLRAAITAKDKENRKKKAKQLPKYEYPLNVLTSTMCGYLAKYGIDYRIKRNDAMFIRSLDAQGKMGKAIFGGGYLLSEKAAAEKAAAEKAAAEKAAANKWVLSDRERRIISELSKVGTEKGG